MGLCRASAVGALLIRLFVVGAAAAAHAAPYSVTAHLREHGAIAPTEVSVRASAGGEVAEVRSTLGGEPGPAQVTVEVPSRGVWTVEASGPGVWSQPRTVVVPQEGSVVLDLWPVGELALAERLQEKDAQPSPPTVTLWSPPGLQAEQPDLDGAAFPCVARRDEAPTAFRCTVPAGRWDVRVRVPGHVSAYLWDLEVDGKRPRSLGTILFKKGASVVGWVAAEVGSLELSRASLALVPFTSGGQYPDQAERAHRTAATTRPNAKGFFHFRGVAPGRYTLRASAPGCAVTEVGPFDVFPGAETALPGEVLLQPPARVTVLVDPALDPWDRRWHVQLDRLRSDQWARASRVAGGEVDAGGAWSHDALTPGHYWIVVTDAEGSRWWGEERELVSGAQQVSIDMDLTPVCGRLTLGEEPVAARLSFKEVRRTEDATWDGTFGDVPSEADQEGTFHGWLPHPGEWLVAVDAPAWNIRRRLGPFQIDPPPNGRCAELEIELPQAGIEGRVVDDEGAPVAGARVTAVARSAGTGVPVELLYAVSSPDGSFTLDGLDPGDYLVDARAAGRRSETVTVTVTEEHGADGVTLVVEASRQVRGVVTSSFGAVSGAMAMMLFPRSAIASGPATTGPDGVFELETRGGASSGTLIVSAPGFCLHGARIMLPAKNPLSVRVQQGCGDLVVVGGKDPMGRDLVLFSPENGVLPGTFFVGWNSMNGLPTQRDGGFLMGRLLPGPYLVCAGPEAMNQALMTGTPAGRCQRATVVAGSATEVSFGGE